MPGAHWPPAIYTQTYVCIYKNGAITAHLHFVTVEMDQINAYIPGAPQSRRAQGLEHTWSANKFSSY